MLATSEAAPPPEPPDPRRLLCAAQLLAQDEPLAVAAAMAGLRPATLRALRDDPDFAELLADCRAIEAMPKQAQDERLARYVRRAVERALADGRLGAIGAALRLLGVVPARAAAEAAGDDGTDDEPSPELAAAAQARWGMVPDGEGGWATPDGRPAMPGRVVEVVDPGAGGPARLLDEALDPDAAAEFVAALDARPDPDTDAALNRSAYPEGGIQWDAVTRTLWRWEGPPREERRAAEPALPGDAAAAAPARGEASLPAAPSSRDLLRARLERLVAKPAGPETAEELDLAEAVCAQLWPKWPHYTGEVDFWDLRDILAAKPLDARQLHRLGGCSHDSPGRPPPRPAAPPPSPPKEPPPPPKPRYIRHAVERPPKDLRAPPTPTFLYTEPQSRPRDGPPRAPSPSTGGRGRG